MTESAVVTRMRQLTTNWESAHDRRAIFLSCYALMTENMLRAVDAGEFEDAAWVDMLLHRFAEYYFRALEAWDTGQVDTPAIWQFTFDTARQADMHVLRHLLLGVNAHIGFDLVFALSDSLADEWSALAPRQRARRHRDHCRVNDVIGRTIDRVQDEVVERFDPRMNIVDLVCGRLDEWALNRMIARWREEVWLSAAQLMACSDARAADEIRGRVGERCMRRARALMGERGVSGLVDIL